MAALTVKFEWDDELGTEWLNERKLAAWLFSETHTRPDLLNVRLCDDVVAERDRLQAQLKKLRRAFAMRSVGMALN